MVKCEESVIARNKVFRNWEDEGKQYNNLIFYENEIKTFPEKHSTRRSFVQQQFCDDVIM